MRGNDTCRCPKPSSYVGKDATSAAHGLDAGARLRSLHIFVLSLRMIAL